MVVPGDDSGEGVDDSLFYMICLNVLPGEFHTVFNFTYVFTGK